MLFVFRAVADEFDQISQDELAPPVTVRIRSCSLVTNAAMFPTLPTGSALTGHERF
jgi:hypothetical protein